MKTLFDDDGTGSIFSVTCGDRRVGATGILSYFCDRQAVGDSYRESLIEQAKSALGDWPVVFLDYDVMCAASGGSFTGYRVMARCVAFDPKNPDVIEYAITIFHQPSARIQVTDSIVKCFAELDWTSMSETVSY